MWLWIESGAPYAGTYAALRNAEGQARATAATARALQGCFEVFGRRCRSCHDRGSPLAIPFNPEARKQDRRAVGRPTGAYERIIFEDDPIARFSTEMLLNFSRPRLSPLILGPLAREAGGFGSCGDVFKDRNDPDCVQLLAAIEAGKALIDAEPRFSAPGFKPNRQYVREMKKFGILPAAFDLEKDAIDVFRTDQEYWRSLWTQAPRESAY